VKTLTNSHGSTVDIDSSPGYVAIRTFCPMFDSEKPFNEQRKPTLICLNPSMGRALIALLQAAYPERRKGERRGGGLTERRNKA